MFPVIIKTNLRITLDILSVFGVNHFSPGRSSRTQLQWRLWSFVVLAAQTAILLSTIFYRNYFLRSDLSPVGMLLNLVHYSWMMSTTCITVILSIASEDQQRDFWLQLERLRELRFQEERLDISFFCRLATRSLLLIHFMLLLNLSVFYFISYDVQWTVYVLIGIASHLSNKMFCLKAFVYLEGLRCEVLALERCLQVFVDSSVATGCYVREAQIAMVMDWHSALIATSRHFLALFNWSLFLIFLDGFIMLGVNIYWAYIQMFCLRCVGAAMSE